MMSFCEFRQKCPAVVKLVNEFSRTGTGSDEDSLEVSEGAASEC